MKVIVTGAAGFIGSHVVTALLDRGDAVLGIDNLNDYYSPERKKANLSLFTTNKHFTFVKADIRDHEAIVKACKEFTPEAIIHLAARAGVRPSLDQPTLYYDVNLNGTLALLETARAQDIKTFIFGSSSSVYGSRTPGAFKETDRVDEPVSPYAATKKAGEELCHVYHYLHGLNVTCLRFFTVYGPRGRPDMAPYKFTRALYDGTLITRYGDGSTARDYTFVGDIVQGIISALDKSLAYEVINLGNDAPVTLNKFIKTLEGVTGKKAVIKEEPLQPGDVPYTCADITKAKTLLDYQPRTSLAEGLTAFCEWYLEAPMRKR